MSNVIYTIVTSTVGYTGEKPLFTSLVSHLPCVDPVPFEKSNGEQVLTEPKIAINHYEHQGTTADEVVLKALRSLIVVAAHMTAPDDFDAECQRLMKRFRVDSESS